MPATRYAKTPDGVSIAYQVVGDGCANWARYLRLGASPSAVLALVQMNAEIDVRPVLGSVRVPTLVLHRTGDRAVPVESGRYIAQNIPGAKLVEMPGEDHLPWIGEPGSRGGRDRGIRYGDAGSEVLKGVPGTWEIFRVASQ